MEAPFLMKLEDYWGKNIGLPFLDNPCSFRRFFEMFECERCGECCRHLGVEVYQTDVDRLVRFGVPQETLDKYIKHEGEHAFLLTKGGCPFLKDNLCTVYEARPDNCYRYPTQTPIDGRMIVRLNCKAALKAVRKLQEEGRWKIQSSEAA